MLMQCHLETWGQAIYPSLELNGEEELKYGDEGTNVAEYAISDKSTECVRATLTP